MKKLAGECLLIKRVRQGRPGFWVYGISGFLISGIQYFYVENGVLSITLF